MNQLVKSCYNCGCRVYEPDDYAICPLCKKNTWVYPSSIGETQKDPITALTEEVRSLKQSLKSELSRYYQTLDAVLYNLLGIQKSQKVGYGDPAKYSVGLTADLVAQELRRLWPTPSLSPLISTPDTTPKPTSSESTSLDMRLLTLLKSDPEREWTWTEKCGPTTTGGYSHTISISLTKIEPR